MKISRLTNLSFNFLIVCFYFILIVYPLNIVLSKLFGINVQLHYLYYYSLVLFLGVIIYLRIKRTVIPLVQSIPNNTINIFIAYILIVAIISIYNGIKLSDILVGFRWYGITFILYYALDTIINSKDKYYKLLNALVRGSLISAVYTIFEFLGRNFIRFPDFYFDSLNHYVTNYATFAMNWYVGEAGGRGSYFNEFGFHRPLGLFLDNHTSSFFMVSGIIILATLGDRLNYKSRKLFNYIALISIAVILQTSRLYVMALILFFIVIIFKKYLLFNQNLPMKNKHIYIYILLVFPLLLIGTVYEMIIKSYIPMINILSTNTITTSHIVLSAIRDSIPYILNKLINEFPFNFLFGFGFSFSRDNVFKLISQVDAHGEMHALMSTFFKLGLVGLAIYFSIFTTAILKLFRAFKGGIYNMYKPEAFCGFLLILLFFMSFIHYNSISYVNQFIMSFALFITSRCGIIKKMIPQI